MKSFPTPGKLMALSAVAFLLALAGAWGTASAQEGAAATPAPAVSPEPMGTVSLDATETSLPSILSILAAKGNLNIISGPGVGTQKLTIHLKDVPVDEAVNLVVRAAGLSYDRIGNSIVVADRESIKNEVGIGTYILKLRYLSASDMKLLIANLTTLATVDSGSNSIIVQASPRVMNDIRRIANEVDLPVQQVEITARIVEVSTNDLQTLGIDWSRFNSFSTIWSVGKPGNSSTTSSNGTGGSSSSLGTPPDKLPTGVQFSYLDQMPHVALQNKALDITLDAIIDKGQGKVLANPRLITTNGHEAQMLVGQVIPYVVQGIVQGAGGVTASPTIEKEEVGVKLRVLPKINADGYITVVITPELSSVLRFTGQDNTLPIVSRRIATTTVRLKDGQSVVIGGLLDEENTKTVTRVPILGDIPGLGELFKHSTETTTKTDLIIELTPKLLPNQ